MKTNRGSQVFQKVRASKDVGGYQYFAFSPDIDLLEVTPANKVIAYELKGYRKRGGEMQPPMFYEGIDEGLANLLNPRTAPSPFVDQGSIFDEAWVVHPEGSNIERMVAPLAEQTPLGLMVIDHKGVRIPLRAKPNPYLDANLKGLFLENLGAFDAATRFKIKPIQ